jgi:hypothetical protein
MERRTASECKNILKDISRKLCIRPGFIAERLMSHEDKEDMLIGDLSVECLEVAVKLWLQSRMPDYAHGLIDPYKHISYREIVQPRRF